MTPSYLTVLEKENLWGYRKRLRFILHSIEEHFRDQAPASITVLDVGCGNGSMMAIPLASRGYRVTGVDVDFKSIAKANELGHDFTVRFLCAGVDALNSDVHFDVVICSEVLEHVDDPADLLRQGAARLHSKGLLLVTVPNGYGPFEIESYVYRRLHLEGVFSMVRHWLHKFRRRKTGGSTENVGCGHQHFFTQLSLKNLFTVCGLRVKALSGGSLLCGPLSETLLRWFPSVFEWNARVTDYLPLALSSSWYFALVRATNRN